jgi:hypothetical protein
LAIRGVGAMMQPMGDNRKLSGAECLADGLYHSFGCGHEEKKEFKKREIFPKCSICHVDVLWVLNLENHGADFFRQNPHGHIQP